MWQKSEKGVNRELYGVALKKHMPLSDITEDVNVIVEVQHK